MTRQVTVNRAYLALMIAVVAGLSAYLLYPTLFLDRSLAHGDNVDHGYAFLKFHYDVLHNGLSPLWTNLIYGGHALFAEGQAGLSNPVNYLVAWLLPPERGHNLLHWLAMTAFGAGCYGLSRSLAITPASSLFAALAAGFSSLVIHANTNMTAIEALVWVPWTMWAFESWLRKPCPHRAIAFGLATAMLVFSGYPHYLHGTVIYLLASLCTLVLGGPLRETLPRVLKTYWRTGLLAIIVCIAISSIQWLPLLELAALSHRQNGVGVAINGTTEFLIRGLLYSVDNVARTENLKPAYFPNTGSLLVCFLASLSLILPSSARIKGHIVATLLLLNLGFGDPSPVYRFVTSHGLVPGIGNFRLLFPYFMLSIIGMAVLAASSLDSLARFTRAQMSAFSPWGAARWGLLLATWCAIIYRYHTDAAPLINYVILSLAAIGLLAMAACDKQRLYPVYAGILLLGEIFLLKLSPFGTVETSLLTREPSAASYIKSTEGAEYFKHYQLGLIPLTFSSPYSEELGNRTQGGLNHLVASTNLLWGIPSFSGALALPSYRKPMTDDAVTREIEGGSDDRPGNRLMDILSIKWFSNSRRRDTSTSRHLVPIRAADGRFIVWENPYARPLIQTYTQARFVDNAEQALDALTSDAGLNIYVEADPGEFTDQQTATKDEEIILKTLRASATRYRFISNSKSGFWLFLADTWYPGWRASIDDKPVKVYPAQVLGKAIFVPPGKHGIKIYFRSDSFRLGAAVSVTALSCLLLYGALRCGAWVARSRRGLAR